MMNEYKTFTVRFPMDVYDKMVRNAEKHNRVRGQEVIYILREYYDKLERGEESE